MTDQTTSGEHATSLRIALNRHLSETIAQSSTPMQPAEVGAAANILITAPVEVHYEDPLHPALDFVLPPARFVAIEQAAGWVYGLTINPQLAASAIQLSVAVARDVERRLAATKWARAAGDPRVDDTAINAWLAGSDEEVSVGRYTAASATLRITIERTGAPSPSERLRGKQGETYFVTVRITDFSNHSSYQARVLARARAQGVPVSSLRLGAFMHDSTRP